MTALTPLDPKEIELYFDRLWPICRSITGNGVRESLAILQELVPLTIHEIPSGTSVLDWTVPKEWNIRDAYIELGSGKRIAQFKKNNLHIVSYSTPFDGKVTYEELKARVHTIPDMPNAIPYITTYYKERWGFCMSQEEWDSLDPNDSFHVHIDTTLEPGSMSYGEVVLKGETEEEIFFSTYICHPSMANNELSGPLVTAFLYKQLAQLKKRRYTYRFIFIPETIGAIAYLAQHGEHLRTKMKAGYVVTCVGDEGKFHYKRSRRGNSEADRAAEHFLKHCGGDFHAKDFVPDGSDERQYCSPGFNLPVGSLMRTSYYLYKEYHTSFDNKNFISFEAMKGTVEAYVEICRILELNRKYKNLFPYGEPQLGKRNLYPDFVAPGGRRDYLDNLLFLLNFSDGEQDLLDIATRRGRSALEFEDIIGRCIEAGILDIASE